MTSQTGNRKTQEPPSATDTILDPETYKRRRYPIWTTVALLIVVGIVISIVFGILQQIGALDRLNDVLKPGQPGQSVFLVESRDDLVVMSINRSGRYEVRVMDATTRLVEDTSRGALQATQPTLSHSGNFVAYFAMRNDKLDLDIAEVGGSSRTLIASSQLSILAKQKSLEELQVCSWSAIWWSETDRYLAFFICTDEDSLVAVEDRDTDDLLVLDSTQVAYENIRTLAWLSETELAVVQADQGFDAVWVIDVISGQRYRVFGP